MSASVLLHLIVYAAIAVFALVVIVRFFRMQSMPLHLRWELYPVGHEIGDKARYGGSNLEEVDWWTKPIEKSKVNELRAMVPEILFLIALFENNRKLWWVSFPFHFGLYILAGLIGLLACGSLLELAGVTVGANASFIGFAVYYLTQIAAVCGLILATVGAAGLLYRRLCDPELEDFTTPSAIFNLVFFLVVFAIAWIVFLAIDPTFNLTRSFIQSLVTFNLSAPVGGALLGLEILLASLLIAYIPMTHMSHFFLKWFTYHKIRWDDEPNLAGSKIEKKIMEQVQYPVTWAAPHINADGKKTWVDIATEETEEKK